MFFKLIKNSPFIQRAVIRLSVALHPSITNQLGKIEVLKKAFLIVQNDHLEGSYFEFGTYEGNSLLAALHIHRVLSKPDSSQFFGSVFNRKFYGFDSFEGFKPTHNDAHPYFRTGLFRTSFEACKKRFARYPEVQLIKGYFEDSIEGKKAAEIYPGEKCAILFIDCDLKMPAVIALNFMSSILQKGSIILIDDVFNYKASPEAGTYGAWLEFLAAHPHIKVREFFDYGCTGKSYIVYDI